MRNALVAFLLLLVAATQTHAQSFDSWREKQRWLPASLDDRPWKTWFWHSAFVLGAGYGLHYVTGLDVRVGGYAMVLYYAQREFRNARQVKREGRRPDYLDHVMDVAAPVVLLEVVVRL